MKIRSLKHLLAGAAVTVPLVIASSAFGQQPLVVTDLEAPRGISPSGSHVLVAEQGGRILRVSDVGTVTVIADGLPSVIADSPEGPLQSGPDAVIQVGATYYFTVGEAIGEKGFDSLYSVIEGQEPVLIADLVAYEEEHNVDGGVDATGAPETIVNLYDLVWDGKNGLFVSASGANAVFHVTLDGEITPYAIFKDIPNPLFPALGGPTMDQVPTGLEYGPDGALYVSTLTGFPFPKGGATVYRLEDLNGDGDATDPGEVTVYASGLTTATNIAFDTDGSLLVAQFSLDMLSSAPGNIVRVVDGKVTETVAEPLISPTGLTVAPNGDILVSLEFLGIVAEAETAAAIVRSAGPPPTEPASPTPTPSTPAPITPPSTGDAGLAASSSMSLLAAAVIAIATLGSTAVAATVVIRR